MPEYLHPGVFIEEMGRGPHPIEGVPTSTAAFIGEAERGPLRPLRVTSYAEYQRWFGDVFDPSRFLPYAVNGFFANGGGEVFICRVVGDGATAASADFGGFTIRAAGPGEWGNRVFAKISPSSTRHSDGSSVGFRLQLAYWRAGIAPFDCFTEDGRRSSNRPTLVEEFDDIVTSEASPDFYGKRLPVIDPDTDETNEGRNRSALVSFARNVGVPFETQPAAIGQPLAGGADAPAGLGIADYLGLIAGGRSVAQGLAALEMEACREVTLVYAPFVSDDIARAVISHCENRQFRFAVVDSQPHQNNPSGLDPRTQIADTEYAAFYYPWLVVADPRSGERTLVPPGGAVLGIYARSDRERGVFKAPANETVRGALAVEFDIDDRIQDELNPKGVNVVRSFPGRGIRVWGARTMTSNGLWRYVNVRRLLIFLERSIYEGTRWVVFEPNDDRLWARVVDSIRLFLRTQWVAGALLGRTEQEAFFVTCDRTTMTKDDILNGRLKCDIGIAPVKPAEFIVFRICQSTAEAQR